MNVKESSNIFIQSLHDIGLSSNTIISYQTDLNQFIECIGEATRLDDITYPDISDFFSKLKNKNLANASLKRKRIVIQRFLKFCYEKRLCNQNNATLIDPMRSKNNNKPKDVLTPEEITKIMNYLNHKVENYQGAHTPKNIERLYVAYRNRLLIYILLYTGCRAKEAVSIEKSNVSLTNNTIGIIAKGNKYNEIPIHNKLVKALEIYKESEVYCKEIYKVLENSIYLFPSRKNKNSHISTRTLYDLMLELSGLLDRNIHAHLFRHTFASYSIASGINISTLSNIISHSSPAITLSIYTHEIESKQKQEEMKKLQFNF